MHVTFKTCALSTLIVNSYSELANKTSLTDENNRGIAFVEFVNFIPYI